MNARQRWIAPLVKETADGIVFVQQSRCIASEDESKLRPASDPPDIQINISSTTGIWYCPSCAAVGSRS